MSIKEHVFKYFNLLDVKKRFGIKNKYVHYLIMHRLLNEMPVVINETISSERMMKILYDKYGYVNKCDAIKFIESELLTNYVSLTKKPFDEIGFKIFCALIRKNFMINLVLSDCSLNDYNLSGLLIVDFTKLSELNISHNKKLSDYSIRILEECSSMRDLRHLNISETGISPNGVLKITKSNSFSRLSTLSIKFENFIAEIDPLWFKHMKKLIAVYILTKSYKHCNDEDLMEKFIDTTPFQRKNKTKSIIANK